MQEDRRDKRGYSGRPRASRPAYAHEGPASGVPQRRTSSQRPQREGAMFASSSQRGKPTRRTAPKPAKPEQAPRQEQKARRTVKVPKPASSQKTTTASFRRIEGNTGVFAKVQAPAQTEPAYREHRQQPQHQQHRAHQNEQRAVGVRQAQARPAAGSRRPAKQQRPQATQASRPAAHKRPAAKRMDVTQHKQQRQQKAKSAPRKTGTRTSVNRNAGRSGSSKPKIIAVGVICLLLFLMLLDIAGSMGKVHHGVTVGGVSVSGLSEAQAAEKIETAFAERLESNPAIVLPNPSVKARDMGDFDDADGVSAAQSVLSESDGTSWTVPAKAVGAHVDSATLAHEAYESCRGIGGLATRLTSWFAPVNIAPELFYDNELSAEMLDALISAAGIPMVDASVSVNGIEVTTHDGNEGAGPTLADFEASLTKAYLSDNNTFEFSNAVIPQNVTPSEAARAAELVRAAIDTPVSVTFDGGVWWLDPERVGTWVSFKTEGEGDAVTLVPTLDPDATSIGLKSVLGSDVGTPAVNAAFSVDNGKVVILESQPGEGPNLERASEELAEKLFGAGAPAEAVEVELMTDSIEPEVTTAMLQSYNVTAQLSSYTTTFTSSDERINNISQAARYINGTVIEPGDRFSFNEVVGERTPARGFMAAGTLVGSEIVDEVGGGICQVATTVFNAAYEAGLPIPVRFNHTKYIPTYPDGRDAAVSWPDLDLQFTNDTDGPIYIAAIATDSSITIEFWGTATGRTVATQKGEWQKGQQYKKVTKIDKDYPKGYSELETHGVDGSSLTITRTVYNADGSVHLSNEFVSTYLPVNEVTVKGPDA